MHGTKLQLYECVITNILKYTQDELENTLS